MRLTSLLLLFTFISFAGQANALRCGQSLVSKGDRKFEVVEKCGQPDDIEDRVELRSFSIYDSSTDTYREQIRHITLEEWTYNFGPGRFIQLLQFENGKVKNIQTLGRGYYSGLSEDQD